MTDVLLLTHVECEGPGLWGGYMEEEGITSHRVRLNDGEPLPDLADYRALFVLGGPMNVDEHDTYPWLVEEKAYIKRAVDKGTPVIGLCLGSQLLARALGAEVTKNPVKEIGWGLVTLTRDGRDDRLLHGLPQMLPVFQWHGDTFGVPGCGALLAESTLCAHQAFRFGDRAYGLQFHVEVERDNVAEWIAEYREEFDREMPPGSDDRMIMQARENAAAIEKNSRIIFNNALEVCGLA